MALNISLTPAEFKLVSDADILLTKNEIIKKVINLFAAISGEYLIEAKKNLPPELTTISPKISRGENYLGLPYVILDYPRNFKRDNTFSIRTFFWWGNFFSIHLQLSGEHQKLYAAILKRTLKAGVFNGWYVGVNEHEWEHHFENDNYRSITNGKVDIDIANAPFIKLAKKIPLNEWDTIQIVLVESFKKILDGI